MKPPLLREEKIIETIRKLPQDFFTILEFMETFKKLFPDDWKRLVERFGLFGEKKRYTVATYLANRIYTYSHKPNSLLKPFRRYTKGKKDDYRRATKEERESFGSLWIAIYRKVEKRKS
jgi:hypothetical protein